jgi:hypothetical protein
MSAGKATPFLSSGTRLSAQAEGLACEIVKAGGRGWALLDQFHSAPTAPSLESVSAHRHVTRN